MQKQWSWEASHEAGWLPLNVSHMPTAYLNICSTFAPHEEGGAGAAVDLLG